MHDKGSADAPITDEERGNFLDEVNRGYLALRADPEAWEAELAERRLLDATLLDGLDLGELWADDGSLLSSGPTHSPCG
jgi:hypothetical protein